MADSFKKETIREINRIAKDNTNPQNVRQIASAFANKLVDVPEEQVKQYLWANMSNTGLAYRTLLNYLPEEGSKVREFVLVGNKPVFTAPDSKKIGEMFKDVGGESILDQGSPNFFGYNTGIDRAKVRAVAKANGMTEEELWKVIQEESTKMEREKIASGEREEGWNRLFVKGLGFAFPRSVERVRRGEDLKAKDLGLDIGENVAYTTNPVFAGSKYLLGLRGLGRFAPKASEVLARTPESPVGKYAKNLIEKGVEASTNPLLMEGADVIAYNVGDKEAEDFGRAKFKPSDVAVGTGVNLTMPLALRGIVQGLGRAGSYAMKRDKVLEEIGKGQTYDEFVKMLEKNRQNRLDAKSRAYGRMRGTSTELHPQSSMTASEMKAYQSFKPASENDSFDDVIFEIMKIKGKNPKMTLDEATQIYLNQGRGMTPEESKLFFKRYLNGEYFSLSKGGEIHPKDKLIELINKSDYAPLMNPNFTTKIKRDVPTDVLSLVSNKAGDVREDKTRRKMASSYFPFVESDYKKEEEEMKKEAERKAMERFLFGLE